MRLRNFVLLLGLIFIATTENNNDTEQIIPVDSGSDFAFRIVSNTTETINDSQEEFSEEESSLEADYADDAEDGRLPLGEDKALNVTFEEDGTPLVDVDRDSVDALAALLMEHDERFHFDFPGHNTLQPNGTHVPAFEVETPTDTPSNDDSIEEESTGNYQSSDSLSDDSNVRFSEDGHMFASDIDPSLSGHVDVEDTADLAEMIVDKPPKLVRNRRAYFYPKGSKWPNGNYYYVFDRQLNPKNKEWFLQAFKEIGDKVPCVKFLPATRTTKNFIIHTSQSQGCYATTLGMIPGKQTLINVSPFCGYPTTMHEVYHALGAIHTQSRPDRDQYVEINWQNIKKTSLNNFQKVAGRVTPETSEYDYKSTMHYPYFTGHAVNSKVGSVRSRDRKVRLKKYGHYTFSEQDYESLREWYGCKRSKYRGRDRPRPSWLLASEGMDEDSVDCEVSPWGEWTWCSAGFQSRKRTVVQDPKGIGLSCPSTMVQRRLCVRSFVKRSAESTEEEEGDVETEEEKEGEKLVVEEGDGNAVAHLKKTVDVVEGTPIVLAVSNPQNLTVQWFIVINGEEHEIPGNSTDYVLSRTIAGNERLTVDVSSVEEHDEMLIVTKVSMKKTVLRVAWNIRVVSEDEYLSRGESEDLRESEDFNETESEESVEEDYEDEDWVNEEDLIEEEEAWINEEDSFEDDFESDEDDFESDENDSIDVEDFDEEDLFEDDFESDENDSIDVEDFDEDDLIYDEDIEFDEEEEEEDLINGENIMGEEVEDSIDLGENLIEQDVIEEEEAVSEDNDFLEKEEFSEEGESNNGGSG